MPELVVEGALIKCAFGVAPMPLSVMPPTPMTVNGLPVATIENMVPMVNIPPFGMCTTPSNPEVAAALGAPMPCVPVVVAPWAPGSEVDLIDGVPALVMGSTCMCTWGGVIEIMEPMQMESTAE